MQPHEATRKQHNLPFLEAEISADERFNYLGLALMRVEADIYLANLVKWIFNVTKGGVDGEFEKSYDQIAARPWGLCCSTATAKRTAYKAESVGLVKITQQLFRNGAQRSNTYAINWDGIRRILNLKNVIPGMGTTPDHTDTTPDHTDTTPDHTDTTPCHTDTTPCQPDTRYKEIPSYGPSNGIEKYTGPDRRAETGPTCFFEDGQGEKFQATQRTQTPADPRMVSRRQNTSQRVQRIGSAEDVLRAVLFEDIPELAEASQRIASPLPAGNLIYGPFKPEVVTIETLKGGLLLAEWFRRQLSIRLPVCGETEADLLLVFSAARYALEMPASDVLKTRVAIFNAQVSRGKWRQVLHFVKAARKRLDDMQRVYPDVLVCEAWPPTPAVDFSKPITTKGEPQQTDPDGKNTLSEEELTEWRQKMSRTNSRIKI
jgi:hypothetical protein